MSVIDHAEVIRPGAAMTSATEHALRGPLRAVVRELPSRIEPMPHYKSGARTFYRYELKCGHVVERRTPRRKHCHCEECR